MSIEIGFILSVLFAIGSERFVYWCWSTSRAVALWAPFLVALGIVTATVIIARKLKLYWADGIIGLAATWLARSIMIFTTLLLISWQHGLQDKDFGNFVLPFIIFPAYFIFLALSYAEENCMGGDDMSVLIPLRWVMQYIGITVWWMYMHTNFFVVIGWASG